MNRFVVSLGVCVLLCHVKADAQATIPSFANLKWLSAKPTVNKQMELKGYKYLQDIENANGSIDQVYTGDLLNYKVEVINLFNKKDQLVRTMVIFTKSSDLYKLYMDFKNDLDKKYEEGIYINKTNESYRMYDSLFQSELKSGKEIFSLWVFDDGYEISEEFRKAYTDKSDLQLTINYLSPDWESESKDRNDQNDL